MNMEKSTPAQTNMELPGGDIQTDNVFGVSGTSKLSKLVPKSSVGLTIIIVLVATIDSTNLGYDGSLVGSFNVMESYLNYFEVTTPLKGLLTSSTYVGGAISCLFTAPLVDKIGRKKGMLISAIICLIGAILQGAAQNTAMFIMGRIFIGLGSGVSGVAAPTFVSETAPYKWRAFALGIYFSFWFAGGVLASGICLGTQSIASNWAWRIPSLLQGVMAFICMLILLFIPESPRWLVYQDRHEEALEIVAIAHSNGDITDVVTQTQFREIIDTLSYEKGAGKSLSYIEALRGAPNRRRVLLCISVAAIVMLSGANIITNYFGTMLSQAGVTDSTAQLQVNVVLSIFSLLCAVAGCFLAERLGRRWLCMSCLLGCAFFFFLFGGLLSRYTETSGEAAAYGNIVCMFLFSGAYAFGLQPMTVIYPPEVLPYSIRASGLAITTLFFKMFGIFCTFVWPFALEAITWKSYMINAAFDLLLVTWVYFTWVETRNKSLEEIDEFFDGEKHTSAPALADLQREIEKSV